MWTASTACQPKRVASVALFGPLIAPPDAARTAMKARAAKARGGAEAMQEITEALLPIVNREMRALVEAGVDFVAVDFPQANRLTVHILAAVAEHEASMISARTKAALTAAKARGVKLGGQRGSLDRMGRMAQKGNVVSAAVRRAASTKRNDDLLPVIDDIRAAGLTSPQQIADGLNQRGIAAARGGVWSAVQVRRVLSASLTSAHSG